MLRLHTKLLQYYYDDVKHDRNFVIEILDSKPYHCFKIKNLPINDLIYCINKTIKNYNERIYFLINNIDFNNYSIGKIKLLLNTYENNKSLLILIIKRLNNFYSLTELFFKFNISILYLNSLYINNEFIITLIKLNKSEELLKLSNINIEFKISDINFIINSNTMLLNNMNLHIDKEYDDWEHIENNTDYDEYKFKVCDILYKNKFLLKYLQDDFLKFLCEKNDEFIIFLIKSGFNYTNYINYNYEYYSDTLLNLLYLKDIRTVNLFNENEILNYIDIYGLNILKYLNRNKITEKVLKKLLLIDKNTVLKELLYRNIL